MSRRTVAALLVAVILGGCRSPEQDGIVAEARPLDPADPARTRLGAVEVLSIHQLRSDRKWFGGISGLSFDGHTVTAINDVGHWLRFGMRVDESGRPVAFDHLQIEPLGGLDGSKEDGDAEEVRATDAGWIVSFERRHRLMRYPQDLSSPPERLAVPTAFADQPDNGGVEAMTPLADGRLLLLSEEGETADGLGQAWVGRPGAWDTLAYRRTDGFCPTSAVMLPGGDVLVLERRFTVVGGVAARLKRVAAAQIQPGAVLDGRELFTLKPPLLVDNYEGIAVWPRQDGKTVAYIVSDDNLSPWQATLLMSVVLPD